MLKTLDNRFSYSMPELKNQIAEIINEIDIEKELERNINLIKNYLINSEIYDEWVKYIDEQIHLSIPDEVKEKCKVCLGISKLNDERACVDHYLKAEEDFFLPIILHVKFLETNKHIFKSKDIKQSLTNELFESFEFSNGKLLFNAEKYDNTMLTNMLILLRESFADLKTKTAIKVINDGIEELETHKLIATSTNRIVYDLVKPQLKFLKKQLKYYEKKLLTESLTFKSKNNIDNELKKSNTDTPEDSNSSIYSDYPNVFQKSMPIQIAVNHFEIFTIKNSKNGEPFLTKEQLDLFIKKAFCGTLGLPKQTFNQMPKGEKFIIQYRFREFYEKYWEYFGTGQVQEKFIKLLTENFTGWDFENVKNNFKTKPKKTLQLL